MSSTRGPIHPVLVADHEVSLLRRPADLVETAFCVGGIIFVVLLGLFAHSTTQGVAEDVREAFGGLIRQVLRMPVTAIESLFVIISPAAVIVSLALQRRYRSVSSVIITGMLAALVAWGVVVGLPHLPGAFVDSLLVRTPSGAVLSLDAVITVLAAMLTVAAGAQQILAVRISWWGIWVLLVLSLIWGTATAPGTIVTVLLGRAIGCVARWILGFDDRRATAADLVQGLLNMGVQPTRIVRSDLHTDTVTLDTWRVSEAPMPDDRPLGPLTQRFLTEPVDDHEAFEVPPIWGRLADRKYRVWTDDGQAMDMHVLDPGRGITAAIEDAWNNVRLRGFSRWFSPALQANAERAVLASKIAVEAGVRTPSPVGIAGGGDSIFVAWEAMPLVAPLVTVQDANLSIPDGLLASAWQQLLAAHSNGIAHRNLDAGSLAVDTFGDLWILDWHQGEVVASDLDRRIDCAQMLAHFASIVGPERALASALPWFEESELMAIAVVLQAAVLPPGIRRRLRRTNALNVLRTKIAEAANTTEDEVAPAKLQRFAPRTLVLFALAAFAIVFLMGSLNFDSIIEAIKDANPWWILAAFLLGTTTWFAAAIPLVAFSPVKLSMLRATTVQVAASIVSLVAPAGIGPAAMNLRFLQKQKLKLPVAVATVTMVQVSQVITSVVLLVVLAATTGTAVNLPLPSMTVVVVAAAVLAVASATLVIPKVRTWIISQVRDNWKQIQPQLLWLIGHPKDLGIAFLGNLLMNVGFVGAFAASLMAFDFKLSLLTITITYLLANSVGAAIPSPGGMGTVEAALAAALQVAGVPTAIAVSVAVLFRLVTFYGRIPFGWAALQYIQKKNIV